MAQIQLKAGLFTQHLEDDLVDESGAVIAEAGDRVVIMPQTSARCVVFSDGDSLDEHWREKASANHTHNVMGGATSGDPGAMGFVPVQQPGDNLKYLRGDGTWQGLAGGIDFSGATAQKAGAAGRVPAPSAGDNAKFLRGDGVWATPENTTYNAMVGANGTVDGNGGLVPAPAAADYRKYLRGDGTWETPTNTTYSAMTGATSLTNGTSGLVPQPVAGDQDKFLRGNGTWDEIPGMVGASEETNGTAGLVPAPGAGNHGKFLRGDGAWMEPENTDTHYTANIVLGASSAATGNATTDNSATYLNIVENGRKSGSIKIAGSGAASVAASGGTLTISSTDTTYGEATTEQAGLMSAADKAKLAGLDNYAHPSYTALTGKPAANQTPAFGGTVTISQVTSDSTGHLTGVTDRTITIPATAMGAATANDAGTKGLVPAPAAGDGARFLGADAAWHDTALKATADASGNVITATYATKDDLTNLSNGLVQVVQALPSTGTEGVIYLVETASGSNTYTKYTWENNGWLTLGLTAIDLSNYVTKANAAKSFTANGTTITVLMADGTTTSTFTTQDTTYSNMGAASADAAGTSGLVPAPAAGSQAKFLRGDGTWQVPTDTNTHYTANLVLGSSNAATSNAATDNGSTYLNTVENGAKSGSVQIKGSGATTVSAASGVLTVSTPNPVFVKSGTGAAAGLVPAPSTTAGTTKYLREDGTWQVPPDNNTTYSNMVGASADAAGTAGLVPAPAKGDQAKVLSGAGTWVTNTGDTHYTSHLYIGAAEAASSAATTNGNTYIKLYDNSTARESFKISGSGATSVASDSSGNITISSTNTTYGNMGAATADAAGTAGLVPAPAKGDQAKVLSGAGTWVTNTGDTHWTSHLYAGASGATANAATSNGGTYLSICDNSTSRNSIKITGSGATTVSSDANGVITISSTDNNTDTLVTQNVSTTAARYPVLLCPTADASANQGAKTSIFTNKLLMNPSTGELIVTGQNAIRFYQSGYSSFWRNDGSATYLLVTAQNDPYGTWTSARPITITNSTGVCNINGNAATATKATQDGSGNTITSYYCTLSTAQTISGVKTFTAAPKLNQVALRVITKNTENTTTYESDAITANSSNTTYGNNIALGGGGNVIVGGGESYSAQLSALAGNSSENTYICADGNIYLKPNCNTFANAKTITIDTSANMSGLATVTATTFSGALSGNASTATAFSANKAVTLTGDVTGTVSSTGGWTVNTIRRSCLVGQNSSTTTNPWYKWANFTINAANDDIMMVVLVESTYSLRTWGIMRIHVRVNGSKIFDSAIMEFIANRGLTLADFVMVHQTTASTAIELWVKVATAYMGYRFTVLSEGSRSGTTQRWTLNNTFSAGSASAYTSGTTQTATNGAISQNSDTHWTSHLYAGGSGATANAATSNGGTYLSICDNSTSRNSIKITGSGATTVASDANGVITISSTDNNTVYTHPTTAGNKHVPSGGSSGQFLGWDSAGTAKWVNNPNTNWTSHLYAGGSGATANAATSNGGTYLSICDNTTSRNSIKITGSGATSVSSDANGVITISSTDNNTDTKAQVNVSTANNTYPLAGVGTANATANVAAGVLYFSSKCLVNYSTGCITSPNVFGTTVAVSASDIALGSGCVFTKTISANTTFTFSGVPSGKVATFSLILTNGGSKTVTWPSSVKWAGGSAPTLTSSGIDVLTFITPNGGTNWYGVASSIGAA